MNLKTDENNLSFTNESPQEVFSFKEDIPTPSIPNEPEVSQTTGSFTDICLQDGLSFKDEEPVNTNSSIQAEHTKTDTFAIPENQAATPEPSQPQSTLTTDNKSQGLSLKSTNTAEQETVTQSTIPTSSSPFDSPTSDTKKDQTAEFFPEFNEPYVAVSNSTKKRDITFKEFYKNYCSANIKKNINGASIMLYLCSALTCILSFVAAALNIGAIGSIIDAIFLLGLTLGIHIGKSRACAVIVLIYSILNCIYSLVTTGELGGYLIIIAGFFAVIYTFMARKEYKEYINGF